MQAQRNGAPNRALITPAYNITSTGLYLNNDLYPREPLYRMTAPAQAVAQNLVDPEYARRLGRCYDRAWIGAAADEPAGVGFRADRPRRRARRDPGPHCRPPPGHADGCRRDRQDAPRQRGQLDLAPKVPADTRLEITVAAR